MITAIDKNTALVLIDLQKGIAKGELAHPLKEVLNQAAFLAGRFRTAGLPVVIVTVNPMGAAWTKARVDLPAVPRNTVVQTLAKAVMPMIGFTDIVPEIGEHAGDIHITKKTWNAFYNTTLQQKLQQYGVTGIVLAGISTSVGIEGTARAASELGYNISFAIDAMTDRLPDAHQHSLKNIFPRIGECGKASDIAAMIIQ